MSIWDLWESNEDDDNDIKIDGGIEDATIPKSEYISPPQPSVEYQIEGQPPLYSEYTSENNIKDEVSKDNIKDKAFGTNIKQTDTDILIIETSKQLSTHLKSMDNSTRKSSTDTYNTQNTHSVNTQNTQNKEPYYVVPEPNREEILMKSIKRLEEKWKKDQDDISNLYDCKISNVKHDLENEIKLLKHSYKLKIDDIIRDKNIEIDKYNSTRELQINKIMSDELAPSYFNHSTILFLSSCVELCKSFM